MLGTHYVDPARNSTVQNLRDLQYFDEKLREKEQVVLSINEQVGRVERRKRQRSQDGKKARLAMEKLVELKHDRRAEIINMEKAKRLEKKAENELKDLQLGMNGINTEIKECRDRKRKIEKELEKLTTEERRAAEEKLTRMTKMSGRGRLASTTKPQGAEVCGRISNAVVPGKVTKKTRSPALTTSLATPPAEAPLPKRKRGGDASKENLASLRRGFERFKDENRNLAEAYRRDAKLMVEELRAVENDDEGSRSRKRKRKDTEPQAGAKRSKPNTAAPPRAVPEEEDDGTRPPVREVYEEDVPGEATAPTAPSANMATPTAPEVSETDSSQSSGKRKLSPAAREKLDTQQEHINKILHKTKPKLDMSTLKPARKRKSDEAEDGRPAKKKLKGLSRPRQECFANAALQIIDASLSAEDIEALCRDRIRPRLYEQYGAKQCLGRGGAEQAYEQLKEHIRDQASRGRLSFSHFLGQLLKDLRSPPPAEGSEEYRLVHSDGRGVLSPFLLQQVVAYSTTGREKFNGEKLQDANEWLLMLLGEVFSEQEHLREKFAVEQEITVKCMSRGCDHTHAVPAPAEMTLDASVPDAGETTVEDLISNALEADELPSDYDCAGCRKKGTSIKEHKITKLPKTLLVQLDRVKPGTTKKKLARILHADDEKVVIHGETFEKMAWVRHESSTFASDCGHYVTFRRNYDKWYHLDDGIVREASAREMVDKSKSTTSLILMQKVG